MKNRLLTMALCALGLAGSVTAADLKPVRVILVGDSTMATRSGYGDALCSRFAAPVSCINLARGGRSTSSFRAEGLWAHVQGLLKEGSNFEQTYVLIQFGHNDQPGKPGRSTDFATEFGPNMARYVTEVKAAGAIPVLLSPLSRRSFKQGLLQNDLRPWAEVSLNTAAAARVPGLDLNAESYLAVQLMGEAEADTLAMEPPPVKGDHADTISAERAGAAKSSFDRTHVGVKGANFFARMVQRELTLAIPALGPYFKAEQ